MPTPRQYQFDIDTKRYLNRVNTYRSLIGLSPITNSDAVDIDNFIIGLKDLGLWYNIICYPFRSIHNIGSGATALSLGGGQQVGADATLINAATWSNEGVTRTTASGDFFSTTVNRIDVAPCAHGAVVKNATNLGSNVGYWFTAGIGITGRQFFIGNSSQTNAQNFSTIVSSYSTNMRTYDVPGIPPFTRTSRHYFSHRLTTGTTCRFSLNRNQVSQTFVGNDWNSSSPQFVRFGAYNVALNLTASFTYLSNSVVTDAQDSALYDLIKTTIGKGLGLP